MKLRFFAILAFFTIFGLQGCGSDNDTTSSNSSAALKPSSASSSSDSSLSSSIQSSGTDSSSSQVSSESPEPGSSESSVASSSIQSSSADSSTNQASSESSESSSSEFSSESNSSESTSSENTSSQASSSSFNQDFPGGTVLQLPKLSLTIEGNQADITTETYLIADFNLEDENFGNYQGTTEIKGRGNSTWNMPKKPYRLKLTNSTSLLGMPANRHWVLLANYADKTLMRNDVTFSLGEALEMEYTPRSAYVELHFNGQYQGVYQLTEHIRIGSSRVNIPELDEDDTSPEKITGGYLLEVDSRYGEDFCIDSSHTDMVFCMNNPETLREPEWAAQRDYIEGYLEQTEAAIFADDFADPETGYAAFIDVDSAISYYLINELTKNIDGNLRLSTFLYKKRNGKLFFGPLWDFDLAIGNVDYGGADATSGWHIRTAPWFTRMFADPVFALEVKNRWNQMKSGGVLDEVFERIDARALWLSQVQQQNFERWDILDTYVWPNRVVTGSYQGEVDAMKDWLHERIEWMDAQFNP